MGPSLSTVRRRGVDRTVAGESQLASRIIRHDCMHAVCLIQLYTDSK